MLRSQDGNQDCVAHGATRKNHFEERVGLEERQMADVIAKQQEQDRNQKCDFPPFILLDVELEQWRNEWSDKAI